MINGIEVKVEVVYCLLENGSVFDKVGVNFSDILETNYCSCNKYSPRFTGAEYRAMGVSVVSHPKNPNVPTVHLNVRLFVAFKKDSDPIWWFGGGFDMTPYYG